MKRIKLIRQGYFKKANFDDWVKEGDSVRYYDHQGRIFRIERTVPFVSIATFHYDQLSRLEKSEERIDTKNNVNLLEYLYEESKVTERYMTNNAVSRVIERNYVDSDKKEIKVFRNNKLVEKRIEKYTNGLITKVEYEQFDEFARQEVWKDYRYDKHGIKETYTVKDLNNSISLTHIFERKYDEFDNWTEELFLTRVNPNEVVPQLKFLRIFKYYD